MRGLGAFLVLIAAQLFAVARRRSTLTFELCLELSSTRARSALM
jgi:hypothetical protein